MGIYSESNLWKATLKRCTPRKDYYNLGLTEYLDGVISIRKGLNRQTTRSTVIHAFIFAFGYTIEGEEAMCNFLVHKRMKSYG